MYEKMINITQNSRNEHFKYTMFYSAAWQKSNNNNNNNTPYLTCGKEILSLQTRCWWKNTASMGLDTLHQLQVHLPVDPEIPFFSPVYLHMLCQILH